MNRKWFFQSQSQGDPSYSEGWGGSEGLWGLVGESSWWGRSCLQGFLCLTIQPADLSPNPFDYLKFMTINSSCMEPIGHNLLINVLHTGWYLIE